jgi:hypothetical protein
MFVSVRSSSSARFRVQIATLIRILRNGDRPGVSMSVGEALTVMGILVRHQTMNVVAEGGRR